MNKKSQAFMDFVINYGWAILIIIVAIGALAYFGVFNQKDEPKERYFKTIECTLWNGNYVYNTYNISQNYLTRKLITSSNYTDAKLERDDIKYMVYSAHQIEDIIEEQYNNISVDIGVYWEEYKNQTFVQYTIRYYQRQNDFMPFNISEWEFTSNSCLEYIEKYKLNTTIE